MKKILPWIIVAIIVVIALGLWSALSQKQAQDAAKNISGETQTISGEIKNASGEIIPISGEVAKPVVTVQK